MTSPTKRVTTAEVEAAAWHKRLGEPRVSAETVEAFFEWRKVAENAEAYRRVEQVWASTASLSSDPVLADEVDAVLSRTGKRKGAPRRVILGLGVLVTMTLVAAGGWVWLDGRGVYATAIGEQRSVQLADGSSVRLDTDTRIRVRFAGSRRLIELERGQALFDVQHDAGRPFVVEAGQTQVTALGTLFDVRRRGDSTEVTLVSGAVDVVRAGEGQRARLDPGQRLVAGKGPLRVSGVDVAAATSWAEGRMVFRNTALVDAVAEVNRYLTDPVILDAPGLERESVNGTFKTGDREAFVLAASETLGLHVSEGRDGAVRLSTEK